MGPMRGVDALSFMDRTNTTAMSVADVAIATTAYTQITELNCCHDYISPLLDLANIAAAVILTHVAATAWCWLHREA